MCKACGMGLGVRGLHLRGWGTGGGKEQMDAREETTLRDLGAKNFLAFSLSANSPGPAVKSLGSFLCSSDFGWSFSPVFTFTFNPSGSDTLPFSLLICRYQGTFDSDPVCP